MINEIRQVDGGYIIECGAREHIFVTFEELVNFLAGHFGERGIGETWAPKQ